MTSTYDGIGRTEEWEHLRRPEASGSGGINVGTAERWVSGVAAAALAAYGIRSGRSGLRRLLLPLAGALLGRALTGRCPVNRALGRNTARGNDRLSPVASLGRGEGIRVEQTVRVARPAEELYRFWRNLENLPRFMDHLESVQVLDERRSHWVARGPAGLRVEWDAEIHNEVPGQLLAWRSLPGSEVDHAGSVHFEPDVGEFTFVRVILRYDPPAGKVGAVVARLFGEDANTQVADDLRRFKQVMEAGDSSPAGQDGRL
jgi:uncharacterized membrane protein